LNQAANIKLIKKTFDNLFAGESIRYIKIHGGQYQESALPDLMILISNHPGSKEYKLWIEIKRDWKDKPSPLQEFNIKDLRNYKYITGYISGDEWKENWTDPEPIKLATYLKDKIHFI
jgi:hypothetical protein